MEEKKPSGGNLGNIFVLVVIWGSLFALILSNQNIKNYFSSLLGSSAGKSYENVLLVSPSKNVFSKAKIYYGKRPQINDIAQSLSNPAMVFAATNYGIFVSYDGGLDWYHQDLPEGVGGETPVSKIFTNPARPSEISILILNGNNGIIYTTGDNFRSLNKSFELSKEVFQQLAGNGSISNIVPAGNKFIIGIK